MALPWTAPGFGQGIYPSQAPFFIPGTVDPRLIALISADRQRQQQQIASSIQGAVSGLSGILERRRQDAIASQLLAGSAPQATAVGGQGATPAAQPATSGVDSTYAERGLDLTPTGQPIPPVIPPSLSMGAVSPVSPATAAAPLPTRLSSTEAAQNAALGYPTQQIMRPSELYAYQQEQQDKNLSDMYKKAQIAHLLGYGATGRLGSSNIVTDPATGQPMTVHDAFRLRHPELDKQTPDPWAGAIVKRRGWATEYGALTTKPPKGATVTADQGPYAEIQLPHQKTPLVVPYDSIPKPGSAASAAAAPSGITAGRTAAQPGEKRVFPDGVRVWDGARWNPL